MTEIELNLLRETIKLAMLAREHGNHPFGSLLADAEGRILLRTENTVVTERDCTGHAETNLIRLASRTYSPEQLATYTLYTSTEPCPMCAGALVNARLGQLVYGADDPKAGAAGSRFDLVDSPLLNHRVPRVTGVLAAECGRLLVDFFTARRRRIR